MIIVGKGLTNIAITYNLLLAKIWTYENFQYNNISDNTAVKNDLDFQYSIKWIEGVSRVIRWIYEHNQIENSDNHPFYDRVISAWERLGNDMGKELSDLS